MQRFSTAGFDLASIRRTVEGSPPDMNYTDLTIAIFDSSDLGIEQLKAAVIDALSPAYRLELILCKSFQELMVVGRPFHILILDTCVEQGRGIELSQLVRQAMPDCRIIFVTDYLPHVSLAYRVSHFCLLLKDYPEQLPFFLQKAAAETVGAAPAPLEVHIRGRSYLLPLSNILYLERQGHTTHIHLCNGQTVATREKLSTLLQSQTHGSLLRCHVSYAVNLDHVTQVNNTCCILRDGTDIPISRSNQQQMKSAVFRRQCSRSNR